MCLKNIVFYPIVQLFATGNTNTYAGYLKKIFFCYYQNTRNIAM